MVEIPADEMMTYPEGYDWKGKKVVELGNKKNASGVYREWYDAQGADYVCVDWNGEDGAEVVNMASPLPDKYWFWAPDVVTNFGFTEHVCTDWGAQEQCWYNINHWCGKLGSYLCFVMPYPRHWDHHGVFQPTQSWYAEFAEQNGYAIELLKVNTDRKRYTICGRFRRERPVVNDKFVMPSLTMMYITPPARRVNKMEKECGIEPLRSQP